MDIPKRGASESPEEHRRKVRKTDDSSSESAEESNSDLSTSDEGSELPSDYSSGDEVTTTSDDEPNASTLHTMPVTASTSQAGQSTSSAQPLPAPSAQPVGAQSSQSTSAAPAPQAANRVVTSRDIYIHSREVLGRGRYGVVIKAKRQSDQRDVAIKVMTVAGSSRDNLNHEENLVIHFMAHPHRNLVQYFDTMRTPNMTFLISELSTVGDIFNAMQITNDEGNKIWIQFDENLTRYLIIGIASGLQHMQRLGVAHGDLKLHNILLFPNLDAYQTTADPRGMITAMDRWTPKLTDFSNSQRNVFDPEDPVILRRGPNCALGYAAPESYRNAPYDCIKADLFSLGCCLLAMIMGALPFDARIDPIDNQNPSPGTIAQNKERRKVFVTELKTSTTYKHNICEICSMPLKDLLKGLLEAKPQNRITLDQFFAHEWVSRPKSREFEDVSGKVSILTTHPLIDGIQFVTYSEY